MKVFFAVGGFVLIAMGVTQLIVSLFTHNQHEQLIAYDAIIVGLLVQR